eukprot:TRINITY_DN10278_c0_g1_i4.p1 TRINITY_DN10278_c0_g1~~TRINITY_DN10278_c0_g1_i4.p1  ORF type:complete len:351 (-),score=72.54 TRINITY_DN10278_c0_g1_i4:297-1349(-)
MNLPDELVLSILRVLPLHDLLSVSETCRSLCCVAGDSSIWRHLYRAALPRLSSVQSSLLEALDHDTAPHGYVSWKAFYCRSFFDGGGSPYEGKEAHIRSLVTYPMASSSTSSSSGGSPLPPASTLLHVSIHQDAQPPAPQQQPHASSSSSHLPRYIMRKNRTRLLYIGPMGSGKSRLFYHLKFGTDFSGIYYLRKFGTEVSIDLDVGSAGSLPDSGILAADFEVWDLEVFGTSKFKTASSTHGVVLLVDGSRPRSAFDALVNPIHDMLLSNKAVNDLGQPVPLLVLNNQLGPSDPIPASVIADRLALTHGAMDESHRPWRVQTCCGQTLAGVKDGLHWLNQEIRRMIYMA